MPKRSDKPTKEEISPPFLGEIRRGFEAGFSYGQKHIWLACGTSFIITTIFAFIGFVMWVNNL